jgi:polyferredoxin
LRAQHRILVWLRRATQILFVGFAALWGLRHLWGITHAFDTTCPFGGVETLWHVLGTYLRETGPGNLIALGVLVIAALLTGRAFCGWACPLGTVQEWAAGLSRRLTGGRRAWLPIAPPAKLDRALRLLKYAVLGWVIWSSATAVVPPLLPFCPYRTLFTLNLTSLLGWSVIVGLGLLSIAVERSWCRYLCPLGALLTVFNKISLWRIRTSETDCTSCGRCSRACPVGLDVIREVERGGECIRCLACAHACPREGAIEVG